MAPGFMTNISLLNDLVCLLFFIFVNPKLLAEPQRRFLLPKMLPGST